jgi:precorrin-6Y C5,15-methyltransferase (decarboxylating)
MHTPLPPIRVLGFGLCQDPGATFSGQLAAADVLVAGKKLLDRLGGFGAEKLPVTAPLSALFKRMEDLRSQGKRIMVLAGGDPLFFGIGSALAAHFGPEALLVTPGVSTMQAAAARLALPWDNLAAVSLHGRDDFLPLAHAVFAGAPVGLFTDPDNTPARAAAFLKERGASRYRAVVFEKLGGPDEKITRLSLEEASAASFASPNLVFFLPDPALPAPRPLVFGQTDDAYAHEKGLISKWPVRAAILAALAVRPEDTVWDLGSGSGSIALEACLLARRGQVLAVERDPLRAAMIRENRTRFGAAHLAVLEGEMPACLLDPSLPTPQRIVLGGGLGGETDKAKTLLELSFSRLAPGGRLAVSCVLFSSLELTRRVLAEHGLRPDITSIQAAASSPLGGDCQLRALNPVFVLTAEKEGAA